ncbi:hypothetical protein RclHR1_10170001 [Rhizophagus clarus]|uniref:BTB/POZ domain-containing protein n=1 Tax=Rhizophagus clarus TaxID=94130 RepID=A0A2Z6QCM1_9GLOM|nr:hypothetical protein RclHR1_10170001 [Rhizophagus clarus]GES85074.1 BTB/POZ domain-containing protein [Rhizophagus clarus]
MSFDFSQELSIDYEKLLETDKEYDIIIHVGEEQNVEEFHALSNILRVRSQYFRTVLSNEKKNGKYIIDIPDISPQLFKIILRFIYCGKIDFKEFEGSDLIKLLIAVDQIEIQPLIQCIQKYLIEHKGEFLQKNLINILETVYQHDNFTNLWNFCLEIICKEPEILFNSDRFNNLKSSLLELLLKRDDLLLDEIVIWDNLIKWNFAQHPSIQRDVKKWNKEEIEIMERTLNKFIPLIRFYHISSEDFLDKVYPYKVLLPEDLINNILAFHMKKQNMDTQPPRKPKPAYDSIIIEPQHFATLSSWIDKKENSYYNVKNNPYDFNLLYRASRDGDTLAAFHSKCDYKGATIVIAKITNSEQIVGGYNPLFWDSSSTYKSTKDSFIFSFTNKDDFQSAKVGYSNGVNSIGGFPPNGLIFGGGGGCHLALYVNGWYSNANANNKGYPKIDIPEHFSVDDFEVFQVIKKQ